MLSGLKVYLTSEPLQSPCRTPWRWDQARTILWGPCHNRDNRRVRCALRAVRGPIPVELRALEPRNPHARLPEPGTRLCGTPCCFVDTLRCSHGQSKCTSRAGNICMCLGLALAWPWPWPLSFSYVAIHPPPGPGTLNPFPLERRRRDAEPGPPKTRTTAAAKSN
jgi:hypothetical protein